MFGCPDHHKSVVNLVVSSGQITLNPPLGFVSFYRKRKEEFLKWKRCFLVRSLLDRSRLLRELEVTCIYVKYEPRALIKARE